MTETNNNVDTLQKFGTAFQSKTIRALIDDKKFLERTHDIIETEFKKTTSYILKVRNSIFFYSFMVF